MATAASPLETLKEIMKEAESVDLESDFDLPDGAVLLIRVYARHIGTNHQYAMHVGESRMGTTSWKSNVQTGDLEKLLRNVASQNPGAILREEEFVVSITRGPMTATKLRPIVLQAMHEAFGRPIPTLEEIAEANKRRKAERVKANLTLMAELGSGPAGVAAFNARPEKERGKADFRKADFKGKTLDGVQFGGANVEGADFSGASLVGARFAPESAAHVSIKGAKFVGANLTEGHLSHCRCTDADFRQANLQGAVLWETWLLRADFSGANLSNARLSLIDLSGANFTDATFDGISIFEGQFNEETRWPRGFKIGDILVWKGIGADPRKAATKKEKKSKPTDFAGFVTRLKQVSDESKLDKALKMLKADRFRLFAKVEADHLLGVVKSQSDPDLVYSCRLGSDGKYGCCTQNLNVCGGLRGSPCKHLLVLILGLTQAGELDLGDAHEWAQSSRGQKPELDKDLMAETLLQFKGAESGEVDWRPTETIPEDFYSM